jgi:polyferredoxin
MVLMSGPSVMDFLSRISAAFAPMVVTVIIAWSVMSGLISFGGGEKDIILILPVAIWSILFAVASLIMWARDATLASASRIAGIAAIIVLFVLIAVFTVITWQ